MGNRTGLPRGRPKGSKNKPKPPPRDPFDLLMATTDEAEREAIFKKLPAATRFRLARDGWGKAVRRKRKGAGSPPTVRLVVEGISPKGGDLLAADSPAPAVPGKPESRDNPLGRLWVAVSGSGKARKPLREETPAPEPDADGVVTRHGNHAVMGDGTTRQICDFERWRREELTDTAAVPPEFTNY